MSEWVVLRSGSGDVCLDIKTPVWLDDNEALQLAEDIRNVANDTETRIFHRQGNDDE